MNIDGCGAVWSTDGAPVRARYRNSGPIWADPSFADLTRVTRSGALLAAVRDASAGTEASPSAASPFGADHYLFSHNGALVGWPGTAAGLAATLSPLELLNLEARVDSGLLWALPLKQLRDGAGPDQALAAVMGLLDQAGVAGRFNFLLTDGQVIAATTAGHSLFYRQGHQAGADSVTVASEPADEDPAWTEIPDRSLVTERPLPPDFLADSLRADARAGLTATPKSLPPKWFYDATGSELFEKITALPEYYPTRAEREILQARAGDIAAASQAASLVELGSGSSEKTRLLIDALRAAGTLRRYVPVDVSEQALLTAASALFSDYPGLEVDGMVSDFDDYLDLGAGGDRDGPPLGAFLGSALGHLLPAP